MFTFSCSLPNVFHMVGGSFRSWHSWWHLTRFYNSCSPQLDTLRANKLLRDEAQWLLNSLIFERNLTLMNSSLIHASSLIASHADTFPEGKITEAHFKSGNWVEEWFPQIMVFFTLSAVVPNRLAIIPLTLRTNHMNTNTNLQLIRTISILTYSDLIES